MDRVELPANDEVVTVPNVILRWIIPVHDRHHHLVNDTSNPCSKARVENARQSVYMRRNYADSLICQTEANSRANGRGYPNFTVALRSGLTMRLIGHSTEDLHLV